MAYCSSAAAPGDIDPAKTALAPNYQRPVAGPGPPVLLHTNFRLLCYLKKDVDSRVIVVGSSDTAMGLVDMLMSVPYLSLHRVTLVCAGGLQADAHASGRLFRSLHRACWDC